MAVGETQETATSRLPRSVDKRADSVRKRAWEPSSQLPTPEERTGWDHRYVRVTIRGQLDNRNLSQAMRDGWEACKLSDYKEFGDTILSDRDTPFEDGIMIGGLLLCRRPSDIGEEIQRRADEESKLQMRSVEQGYLRDQDRRVTKFSDHRSEVTFGRGRA